jgi:AraC-like DNA-binding protein
LATVTEPNETVARTLTAVPTAAGLATRLAVAELERRGIDPGPLLARAGLSAISLDRGGRVEVRSQIAFLEVASRGIGDEFLGLTLGEQFDLRELSMLYFVAASSHRFGDALRRLERYVQLGNQALVVRLHKGTTCRIEFAYTGVPRHLDKHQMEFLAMTIVRLCRQLVGQRMSPLAANFVHHRSGDLRRVRKLMGCDVQFGSQTDDLHFDAALLDRILIGEDPFLNRLMVEDCERAMAARPSNVSPFRTVVENIVAPLLPHAEANAKEVASSMGMSERTFARRLAAEGLNFRTILDELRRDLAVGYLEARQLQMSQIAWLLGFQQPSAFSHACRRWTGKSPMNFRHSHRTQPQSAAQTPP